ncbi:MAG: viperin family antiviral radical SAM protein [Candidatus Bathyarchaeota archaeon]|nr:viperin family antiviral radical SAM protein [Candidatus Bathyarchaeota archaeon]
MGESKVKSANWHITARCDYNCRFCFAQQLDSEIRNLACGEQILKKLKALEIGKINFTGGEPLLHPLLFPLIKLANSMNFVVSIISNGYHLNRDIIFEILPFVDWIGLSIDSAHEAVEEALGRGDGGHVKKIVELAEIIHQTGIKLKINTTVTRLNWMEDMRSLIIRLKPDRWKVFQVLHIGGQNDAHFDELSITDEQFNHFKTLNQDIEGITPVFEGNQEMIDSYFMISPSGMAMSNRDGTNRVLTPLIDVNQCNISQIVDVQKYEKRGGIYPW